MKDQTGFSILAGDAIAYAVRDGSCRAALRTGTVTEVSPSSIKVDVTFNDYAGADRTRNVTVRNSHSVLVIRGR